MKRFLIFLLAVVVGVQVGRMIEGVSKTATAGGGQDGGGAEKCAAQNGDVNADGKVDLTDAVTILGHLFLGSPTELVPLCETPGPSGLSDTGQTKCYDQSGAEISCDSATCPGQDGFYATGCPSEGRFVDNGDGTVTDHCTGLMWQKNTADTNGDGQISDDGADGLPWCKALAYCENLSFAGHDDWWLPNVRELQSIVDYGRFNPAIDPVFSVEYGTFYWSSTSFAGSPGFTWVVDFSAGYVGGEVGSGGFVRAVRTAP